MIVRLAFAVAAHLEPEILIVDEVLAVGDAAFQKKCLNKMHDIGKLGATVLFVSHSMPSVTRLCSRGILLQNGRVVRDGSIHDVVGAYMSLGVAPSASAEWSDEKTAPQTEVLRMRAMRVVNEQGDLMETAGLSQAIGIQAEYDVFVDGVELLPNVHLANDEGTVVFASVDVDPQWHGKPRKKGHYVTTAWIPGHFLTEGSYTMEYAIITPAPFRAHVALTNPLAFRVSRRADESGVAVPGSSREGVIAPLLEWSTDRTAVG
jgi:lipopolysaccharide transport system ATP-binding protein